MKKLMERPSASSSEDVSTDQAAGFYNPYLIYEAVKRSILKCLGINADESKPQSENQPKDDEDEATCSCSCSTAATDPAPPSTTTADSETEADADDPPAGDEGIAASLAVPPRPGGSTGRGPRIN
ncbi:hypothetical protein OWV82_024471 [Melia azedarach]|uniref:Uncharacterized protein n=1 Tax=Melia azedarach TaxID=155640 RepID=A0ACC1WQF0_MELAZ|nr:hypothetical protein OWV82_024471 [Melia azedarach]